MSKREIGSFGEPDYAGFAFLLSIVQREVHTISSVASATIDIPQTWTVPPAWIGSPVAITVPAEIERR